MTVDQLICPITKSWDRGKILHHLPQYEAEILTLRPSKVGALDRYVWLLTKTGDYSVKTGYQAAAILEKHRSSQVGDSNVFNWNKEIWLIKCSPKVKFLLWKAMKNALPVGANLKSRGINTEANCPHCGEEETELHLFFHCPFARQVWDQAPFKSTLSSDRIGSLKLGIEASKHLICLPPTGFGQGNLFPWIMWMLWSCRNKRIFEQKHQSSCVVLAQVTEKAIQKAPQLSSPVETDSTTIRCYTDAAWREDSRVAGLGCLFTDPTSQSEKSFNAIERNVSSPLMAEAIALLHALHQASDLGIKKLLLASDSQQLIKALNLEPQPKELYGILHDISSFSLCFDELRFTFVKRELNRKADALAKAALHSISIVPVPN